MDFIEIIITIAILGLGSLLTGGNKKSSEKKPAQKQNNGQGRAKNVVRPAMASANAGSVKSNEYRNRAARNNSSTIAQDYFSYENQPIDWDSHDNVDNTRREQTPAYNPLEQMGGFNLRQAFIYQTILQNDYISDMK
ncbi:MAG: hypothetical protein J6X86_06620 [Bacteroidales bacterium]|nr:hypothetical protein [Bacteroidales bacterium]